VSIDRKINERVEKLLRLAAPSSNTSEPERVSAALEAARLFTEHNLVVQGPKRKAFRTRPPTTAATTTAPSWNTPWGAPQEPSPPGWGRSVAARDSVCADPDCQEAICRGEPVWMRMNGFKVEYIHLGAECGW